jgi:hypothetical protein
VLRDEVGLTDDELKAVTQVNPLRALSDALARSTRER